jgi:hypothetical protein
MGNRIQRGSTSSRTQRTNTCGTSSRAHSAIQTCQGSLLTSTEPFSYASASLLHLSPCIWELAGGRPFDGVEVSGGASLRWCLQGCEFRDLFSRTSQYQLDRTPSPSRKGQRRWHFFYEIRCAHNIVLKRDGGFASQDAAKLAAREDAKKMKNMRQPDRLDVGRIRYHHNSVLLGYGLRRPRLLE